MVSLEVPKRLVLDTTVLVNHLRLKGRASIVTRLEGEVEMATTQVNLFELYFGAYKTRMTGLNLTSVKGLVSTLRVLQLTDRVAENAGKILAELERKGRKVEIRDLFIGVLALEEGWALLTSNVDHFSRIPGLEVVSEHEILAVLDRPGG